MRDDMRSDFFFQLAKTCSFIFEKIESNLVKMILGCELLFNPITVAHLFGSNQLLQAISKRFEKAKIAEFQKTCDETYYPQPQNDDDECIIL